MNAAMADGYGALYNAVRYQNIGAVEALVEAGADPTDAFSALAYYPSAPLLKYLKMATKSSFTPAAASTAHAATPALTSHPAVLPPASGTVPRGTARGIATRGTAALLATSTSVAPVRRAPKRFTTARVRHMIGEMADVSLSDAEQNMKEELHRLLCPEGKTPKLLLIGDSIAEELVSNCT